MAPVAGAEHGVLCEKAWKALLLDFGGDLGEQNVARDRREEV